MSSDVRRSTSTGSRRLICPKCQRASMRRVSRQGFLQEKIYAFFGYYPWECGCCRIIKLFKNRGSMRSHRHMQRKPE